MTLVCKKAGYAFAGDARLALIAIAKKRKKYGTDGGLYRQIRYYKCDVCNLYHLTSMTEEEEEAAKQERRRRKEQRDD